MLYVMSPAKQAQLALGLIVRWGGHRSASGLAGDAADRVDRVAVVTGDLGRLLRPCEVVLCICKHVPVQGTVSDQAWSMLDAAAARCVVAPRVLLLCRGCRQEGCGCVKAVMVHPEVP